MMMIMLRNDKCNNDITMYTYTRYYGNVVKENYRTIIYEVTSKINRAKILIHARIVYHFSRVAVNFNIN